MEVHELSEDQRRDALEKAIAARRKRAEFKERISSGSLSLEEALRIARDDEILRRIRVSDFLKSFPGYGVAKVSKLMDYIGISQSRRIQGIGARQIERLVEEFGC